jgi:hypothetical protein
MKQMKYIWFIGFTTVLSLFIASCENNNGVDNNELSGQKVPVRIRSLSVAENDSEALTRSSLQKEPETILKPIGNGMMVEMNVKREESSLRGLVNLASGTHFRVIAVNKGTSTYYSHGDFVQGTGISPLTDFHVRVGVAYDYICISYNNATLPSASYTVGSNLSTSLSVNNTQDLLWCRIEGSTVTSAGVELDIKLNQKLAKVKVAIDCGYNQWKIKSIGANKVNIKAIPLNCTINWITGALTGTANNQSFSFSTPSTPYPLTLTSNELRIIPTTSNVDVNILTGAVARDGLAAIPLADTPITFATTLGAGYTYTITVRFRSTIWAESNIYWNGTAMKFDTTDEGNQGIQGLYFKWGSLIGISPTPVGNFDNNTPVYKAGQSTPSHYANWDDIPYMSDLYVVNIDGYDLPSLTGDICTYINNTWRMPKVGEFGTTFTTWAANQEGWEKGGTFGTSATLYDNLEADGTTVIINGASPYDRGYAKNISMGVILPASGGRQVSDHSVVNVGTIGNYWYCEAALGIFGGTGVPYPYVLVFGDTDIGIDPNGNGQGYYACPVRCVKN